jgi:hypothetical protein
LNIVQRSRFAVAMHAVVRHWMIRNHGVQEVRMSEPDDQGAEVFEGLV